MFLVLSLYTALFFLLGRKIPLIIAPALALAAAALGLILYKLRREETQRTARLRQEVLARTGQLEAANKELSQEMLRRQEAILQKEEAVKLKTIFFHNLAHETKTPLTLIAYYLGRYIFFIIYTALLIFILDDSCSRMIRDTAASLQKSMEKQFYDELATKQQLIDFLEREIERNGVGISANSYKLNAHLQKHPGYPTRVVEKKVPEKVSEEPSFIIRQVVTDNSLAGKDTLRQSDVHLNKTFIAGEKEKKKKDYTGAIRNFSELIDLQPPIWEARLYYLWSCYYKNPSRAASNRDLDKLLAEIPAGFNEEGDVSELQGLMALEKGDWSRGAGLLEQYQICMVKDPLYYKAEYRSGLIYEKLGRYSEAIASVGKYLAVRKDADAYLTLGNCFMQLKDTGKARAALKRLLSLFPEILQARKAGNLLESIRSQG